MLSAGICLAFASAMALRRRAFASGSPPPMRAAVVISLTSLVNTLPRTASLAPFCRLMVAHLEWPLMPPRLATDPAQAKPRGMWAARTSPPGVGALSGHVAVVLHAQVLEAGLVRLADAQDRKLILGLQNQVRDGGTIMQGFVLALIQVDGSRECALELDARRGLFPAGHCQHGDGLGRISRPVAHHHQRRAIQVDPIARCPVEASSHPGRQCGTVEVAEI